MSVHLLNGSERLASDARHVEVAFLWPPNLLGHVPSARSYRVFQHCDAIHLAFIQRQPLISTSESTRPEQLQRLTEQAHDFHFGINGSRVGGR
jgi:hypothetical protein